LVTNTLIFLIFFLYFVVSLLLSEGYGYDARSGEITSQNLKYLHSFLAMPFVIVIFLAGVVSVLYGIALTLFSRSIMGIWFTGPGTALTVFALFIVAGFNGTSFYPSIYDTSSSLTIVNASSSPFTLRTMMFFSFTVPFIFAYIWYAWNALTNKKISEEEMNAAGHKY
jgi:cytochrome d ubiquinol oxidase subunit II